MSKFNLTDLANALARSSLAGSSAETGNPTCNKCREDEHNRCPTAIENHGRSGWTSNFPECACYTSDVDLHAGLVEADDEAFYESREGR